MSFVDQHKDRRDGGLRWGVEPICVVLSEHGLPIAPATYYAARSRPPSPRTTRDERLKPRIAELHAAHYGVSGVRKMHAVLHRNGVTLGRDQTGRLMRELGLTGVRRGKPKRTTRPDETQARPADLVQRRFRAQRPDQLWVCDLTYLRTWVGFAYLALVIDVFSRRIVGWAWRRICARTCRSRRSRWRSGPATTALPASSITATGAPSTCPSATQTRSPPPARCPVGSAGDSYDNALAESTIGQLKAELVHRRGPWRSVAQLEFALFEYLDWWNHQRLHGEIGMIPPAEKEAAHYAQRRSPTRAGNE